MRRVFRGYQIGRLQIALAFLQGKLTQADLKQGLAHFETKGLSFGQAEHDATVIIRKHDNRHAGQPGLGSTLATDVKVAAIYQGEHGTAEL